MRAGYGTNDYDNRMTDEELGPPHHSLSNLNNNAIRLVIKDEDNSVDDSDGLVVMSHTEPNEGGGNGCTAEVRISPLAGVVGTAWREARRDRVLRSDRRNHV